MNTLPPRLASIDVFRAITMLLMIFVNDLWSLQNIPGWLEHTAAAEDGMGLADTIFPAFLFIVGLSIPFAIHSRESRGESSFRSLMYILTRSFALLVMGYFHVNLEDYNKTAILPRTAWQILITIGFFMVWLDYSPKMEKSRKILFQAGGILLLLIMAFLFKGGDAANPHAMRPQWWGILGLIGWSYLLSSIIFLIARERLAILVTAMLFFLFFNIGSDAGWFVHLNHVKRYVWIVGDGSMPALTMAGVVSSVIYRKLERNKKYTQYLVILIGMALCMIAAGFALRPFWGISKIRATPSWTTICTGISMIVFALLIYVVDIRKKQQWFSLIRPAGTSTLTAYLLPYIHYALFTMIGITLPLFLRTGVAGLIKSLLYALLIVLVTGLLEKWRLRLKI